MSKISIETDRDEHFISVISALVQKGMTFEVILDGNTWEITLTGGY